VPAMVTKFSMAGHGTMQDIIGDTIPFCRRWKYRLCSPRDSSTAAKPCEETPSLDEHSLGFHLLDSDVER
jgi:hypothetical protein